MSEIHWTHGVDPETGEALRPNPEERSDESIAPELTRKSLEAPILILEPRAALCFPSTTRASEVVDKMVDAHESAVLIVDEDEIVGIFTERDVLLRLHSPQLDQPLGRAAIAQFMTPDPEYLLDTDSLAFALNRMAVGGYRHIPILATPNSKLLPHVPRILSVRYLVAYLADFFSDTIYNLPPNPVRKGTARFGA